MIHSGAISEAFPKTARLRKSRDFRFVSYKRFQSNFLVFIYTLKGKGRLGVSIPKKILRRAVARNRVRRMIREAFRKRHELLKKVDVHILINPVAKDVWRTWKLQDIDEQFVAWMECLPQ